MLRRANSGIPGAAAFKAGQEDLGAESGDLAKNASVIAEASGGTAEALGGTVLERSSYKSLDYARQSQVLRPSNLAKSVQSSNLAKPVQSETQEKDKPGDREKLYKDQWKKGRSALKKEDGREEGDEQTKAAMKSAYQNIVNRQGAIWLPLNEEGKDEVTPKPPADGPADPKNPGGFINMTGSNSAGRG